MKYYNSIEFDTKKEANKRLLLMVNATNKTIIKTINNKYVVKFALNVPIQ